ncbi:MAG TPA: hypothetical protein DCY13_14445 [Verrucomicrobiales bacterium]|nr:hypothetical protein [Verrucomicrobiales bacterium]
MALNFMPGQFSDRADFYQQVAALITAGYGLPHALDHLRRNPPARTYRRPLAAVLVHLREGTTFAEALREQRSWMPDFDVYLLEAGEKSGRLDVCLNLLSEHYRERAQLSRSVINDLAYPVLLLHALIFIPAIPALVLTFNLNAFLLRTVGVLVPVYLLVFIGIFLFQSSRSRWMRRALEGGVHLLPIIGRARRELSLARLAMALEALLNAGVNVITSWELAASSSGSVAIDNEVATWRPQIEEGVRPSELLKHNRVFPDVFANLYATGEMSGRLDEQLGRIRVYYRESGSRQLKLLATWIPKIIYLAIVLAIAYHVISFWTGYFGQVREVIDFGQ